MAQMLLDPRPRRVSSRWLLSAGALMASAAVPWWTLSSWPTAHEPAAQPAAVGSQRAEAARVPAPSPVAAAARDPIVMPAPASAVLQPPVARGNSDALPYKYAGHWRQGRHTMLVLSSGGFSAVVRVPGALDDRFDAVAIDERRVLLFDRQQQRTLALSLTSGGAATAALPATAPVQSITAPEAAVAMAPRVPAVEPAAPPLPMLPAAAGGEPDN